MKIPPESDRAEGDSGECFNPRKFDVMGILLEIDVVPAPKVGVIKSLLYQRGIAVELRESSLMASLYLKSLSNVFQCTSFYSTTHLGKDQT